MKEDTSITHQKNSSPPEQSHSIILKATSLYNELLKNGRNSNSFFSLYPGFKYFQPKEQNSEADSGIIVYADTPYAWVGAAEPLVPEADMARCLEAFSEAAARAGKFVILLPVSGSVAKKAIEAGFSSLMIGSEPVFDLERYPQTGKTWLNIVTTVKHLSQKGAVVSEFDPATLSPTERAELDEIAAEWLSSRKTDTLGFLNQVEPWSFSQYKKYFRVSLPISVPVSSNHRAAAAGGSNAISRRTSAFLAAIPILARKGWYLVDLLRRDDSPPGSTELLLLNSMRLLKEAGAKEISLGVAPLSKLELAEYLSMAQASLNRRYYQIFRLIYEKGSAFYNFKTLDLYKQKFFPTSNEPMFLIYKRTSGSNKKTNGLGIKGALSIAHVFLPQGLTHAIYSSIFRQFKKFDFSLWIRNQVKATTVVRSAPRNHSRLLYRCKSTVVLAVAQLIVFLFTVTQSSSFFPTLSSEIEQKWGYSWALFLQHPLQASLLSPFLHWNLLHLGSNLLLMIVFTGGLEYLTGTTITLTTYAIVSWVANPLTSLALLFVPHANFMAIDVGASLGIFGCAGAVSTLLKRKWTLLLFLSSAIVIDAIVHSTLLTFNHCVALVIGFVIGTILF